MDLAAPETLFRLSFMGPSWRKALLADRFYNELDARRPRSTRLGHASRRINKTPAMPTIALAA